MKKVNKQCLLDTPRTVRVSEKDEYNTKLFLTKLLHAYFQCVNILLAKYQIAPSKATVGVDRPMKAPSMHIRKPY